jgi:hypothetical protein
MDGPGFGENEPSMETTALEGLKRRGNVALAGGVVLFVVIVAVWIWVDHLMATSALTDPAAAQFLGKLNVAFGLIAISGLFGVGNGWVMASSGRRSVPLIIGLLVTFAAGLFLAYSASNGFQPPH